MDGTVRVTIRVQKYTWHEFVHDVCFVLYATIMISNTLLKRYVHISLRQLVGYILALPRFIAHIMVYIGLAGIGILVMASMFAVPVILFLAAIGRIH